MSLLHVETFSDSTEQQLKNEVNIKEAVCDSVPSDSHVKMTMFTAAASLCC